MSDSIETQQPAYEVKNLNKIFVAEKPVHALVDINLTIPEGSFTCIVGPSGCGKSTLLRILGGLVDETSGTVNRSLTSESVPSSAFVFQEHGIFPWMNVIDNVALTCQ